MRRSRFTEKNWLGACVPQTALTHALIAAFLLTAVTTIAQASEATLFQNARIFDGEADQLSAPMDLLVEDGVITHIGSDTPAPESARVIDVQGKTLMPGMINAHAHVMLQLPLMKAIAADEYAFAYTAVVAARSLLDNGFTTIRDMSGDTFSLKAAIDQGLLPGPRIYPSGPMISQTSGHGDHRTPGQPSRLLVQSSRSPFELAGMTIVADGVPEVLQAARENLRRGASQIKIAVGGGISSQSDPLDVTQFTEDEITAAVAAAENWGTYVAAHVYNSKGVQRAVKLGVKSIEHANLIDRETMELMADNNVWLSPQVMIFEAELKGFTADQQAKQKQARDGLHQLMTLAAAMDYRNIVFGEDIVTSLAGLNQINQELVLRSRWFTPVQILRQATSRAGELMALSGPRNPYGTVGVIQVGALADILLVEGNPLEDISVLANPKDNIRLIMKAGQVYKNTLQ